MIRPTPAIAMVAMAIVTGCRTSPEGPSGTDLGSLGDNPYPRRYDSRRTTGPITIDGRLDEPDWADAPWTDPFIDIEGEGKPQPRHETRAKMLWDDEYFYIAARLVEPHVWATYDRRDMIVFHENDFEIFIDPNGDTREYYEIEVNALGTIFDLFLVKRYLDGGPALHAWDAAGMKHAVHIEGTLNDPSDTDDAWYVEFALPWSTLKEAAHVPAPPNAGDAWRVNFSRVQWRTRAVGGRYEKIPGTPEDNWVWSPQFAVNMHLPRQWGFVRFVEADGGPPMEGGE
jgi:hypothetical protein